MSIQYYYNFYTFFGDLVEEADRFLFCCCCSLALKLYEQLGHVILSKDKTEKVLFVERNHILDGFDFSSETKIIKRCV